MLCGLINVFVLNIVGHKLTLCFIPLHFGLATVYAAENKFKVADVTLDFNCTQYNYMRYLTTHLIFYFNHIILCRKCKRS